MMYKMRFVQYFDKSDSEAFLKLEKKFVDLENETPEMTNGRRYVPVIGREPTNCMVWEAEFPSMEAAVQALHTIEQNDTHDALLEEQIRFMRDTYVEIYQELV